MLSKLWVMGPILRAINVNKNTNIPPFPSKLGIKMTLKVINVV